MAKFQRAIKSEGVADCPYCSSKKAIPRETSFKALYPNMAIELIDNVETNLDEVLPYYTLILSWKCLDCNLEWKASPKDRSEGVADCPYCSGKKATPGKTSFKAQNHH